MKMTKKKLTRKKLLLLLCAGTAAALMAACTGSGKSAGQADASESQTEAALGGGEGGPGRGRGMIDKSYDGALQALLAETESKFRQMDYQDEETGKSFGYNLFVPDNDDPSQKYPLVLFITDSSVVGNETKAALEQGYGAVIWASEKEQEKHPSFILAPEYPENILNGENDVTDYVRATLNLLDKVRNEYPIDSGRLYMTGQSMGCMTSLYLNATNPELFAASPLRGRTVECGRAKAAGKPEVLLFRRTGR